MPIPAARHSRKKPPTPQYICLAFFFILACGYQIRATIWAFPQFFGVQQADWPFYPGYSHGEMHAGLVGNNAEAAGMHERDLIVAINGEPPTGLAVFGEAMAKSRPGDTLGVTFRTPPSPVVHTAAIRLRAHNRTFGWGLASIVVLKIVLPFFSIFLSAWVVLARPRDPVAWLVIGLLLGISNLFSAGVESWGPGFRDVGAFYYALCSACWPLAMLYFGLLFPEPFPPGRFKRVDRGIVFAKWILTPALLLILLINIVTEIGAIENYAAVASIDRLTDRAPFLFFIIPVTAASAFFISIFMKGSMAISSDNRRRLRLLYGGTTLAVSPTFILIIISRLIMHTELDLAFPKWLELGALSLLLLFPVTLAYVIVVQRALDVRVVLRQGVQYALATTGIRILQGVFSAVVIFTAATLAQDPTRSRPQKISLIAWSFVFILLLRRGVVWLRGWIDRRFFRDAVRAEQILASLNDEVRSIVEKQPLLERVATKIAEALYVPRVAVLLKDGGAYRPAYAVGYAAAPSVELPENAQTVQRLRREPEPERVYFDDEESWVNSSSVTEEERAKLESLSPQLLLPLSVKENLLGIISLGEKKSEEPYSGADVRLLKSVAAQTGLALANAELTTAIAEEVARREKLNREVEIAREVQERLFPQKLPPIPGLDYSGRCRTALGVGGDYYDFLALPAGRLGVALGDVSGKGIAAALMMASLEASLRAEAMRAGDDLAGMIARVNNMIFDASAEDRYATLFYAQYDPATRRLAYVNAGHCAPMLFRASHAGPANVERLDQAGGPVVGLMPECPYEQAGVQMNPGDVLVIYTDGISEAMNKALEEWGEQRLIEAVAAADGQPADALIKHIVASADAFASGAPQHDDMTLVVLRTSK